MKQIEDESKKIAEITSVIEGIAFQKPTSLRSTPLSRQRGQARKGAVLLLWPARFAPLRDAALPAARDMKSLIQASWRMSAAAPGLSR